MSTHQLQWSGLLKAGLPTILALLSNSCSQNLKSSSSEKIYGGNKVKGENWLNTVAISDKNGIFCSGTAVTPRLVITAAHCLESENAAKLKVYVGPGEKKGELSGQYKVNRIAYSPLYESKDEESDHDIGYLLLKEPLDLPYSAYVPIALKSVEIDAVVAVGKSAHLVGFGEVESGDFGVKYEVSSKITDVGSTELTIGGNGKDACSGDSGGPAFGQLSSGDWRVYGVVSRGGDCGSGGIWGLMHASICWIQDDSGVNLGAPAELCENRS